MIRSTIMAAMLALLGVAAIPMTWAQSESAPSEQTTSYSDTELKSFAAAAVEVHRIFAAFVFFALLPLAITRLEMSAQRFPRPEYGACRVVVHCRKLPAIVQSDATPSIGCPSEATRRSSASGSIGFTK